MLNLHPTTKQKGLSRKQPIVIDRGEAPQATAQGAALRPAGTTLLQRALKGRKPVAYGASPLGSVPVFHYAGLHPALLLTPLRGYQYLVRDIIADNRKIICAHSWTKNNQ
jgi:hypothetical protein